MDELKSDIEKRNRVIASKEKAEGATKKEIQGLKYDNKRINMELRDQKDRYEKVK